MEDTGTQIQRVYDYRYVPTVQAFVNDESYIDAIMGPVGSGKSSGCVKKVEKHMFAQAPHPDDNVRYTRWALVRNTNQQLKDTVKKTVQEWMPYAKWRESESMFIVDVRLSDGTEVYSELLLRALDRPDQVDQLLSLELTGAWLNEARELPRDVFKMIQTRVGRYPKRDPAKGISPSYRGVFMDTNPPDIDHWFYTLFEKTKPHNAKLYKQPSGRSKMAENLPYLDPMYYQNLMVEGDEDYIRVYVDGEYGYLREGKPVLRNYRDNTHVFTEELKPLVNCVLTIGMDCGLSPAAVITQLDPRGRLLILDEVVGEFMSAKEFLTSLLKPLLRTKYRTFEHQIVGDPAGAQRSQVDSRTVYQEIRFQGLSGKPARTNIIQARISAVDAFLTRMVEGKPAFIISPQCSVLRKALSGGYKYRRLKVSGERFTDVPEKNEFSHVADALQYACLEHEAGYFGSARMGLGERYEPVPDSLPVEAWT